MSEDFCNPNINSLTPNVYLEETKTGSVNRVCAAEKKEKLTKARDCFLRQLQRTALDISKLIIQRRIPDCRWNMKFQNWKQGLPPVLVRRETGVTPILQADE